MPPKSTTKASGYSPEVYWWNIADKDRRGEQMVMRVDSIHSLTTGRIRQWNSNVETYGSPERGAMGAYGGFRSGYKTGRVGGINKDQFALPVVWSVIQALVSQIMTNEPRPQYLPNGGDFKARREADLLTNLTAGVYEDAKIAKHNRRVFVDALVGGTGYKIWSINWETSKIECERCFPPEMITDPNDDIYGTPRTRYRVKYCDRDEISARFKIKGGSEAAGELRTAKTLAGLLAVGNAAQTNMVKLFEAWHLPSSQEAKDGRHMICTSNDVLLDEAWEFPWFPVTKFFYDERMLGELGLGIPEMIGNVQNFLNEMLFVIQQSSSKHGVPHWIIHNNANISKHELNDLIGSGIYWGGEHEPKLATFPSFPPDIFELIQWALEQIYQQTGVSVMAASAQKPAGLDSGAAIRTYVDTQSARFKDLGARWEEYACVDAEIVRQLALKIVNKEDATYPVHLKKQQIFGHSFEVLDWKAAKGIKNDTWKIQCFPVSSLPSTPTGKLQAVKDLQQIGPEVVDNITAVELLDLPDVKARTNIVLAQRRLVERWVSQILDDGRYTPPEADCLPDIGWVTTFVAQSLAFAELEDAPADRLVKLRKFQAQITDIGNTLKAAAAPPPMPGPPQPGMNGAAPPVLPPAPMAPLAPVAQPGQ